METPGWMIAPAPIQTLRPMRTGRLIELAQAG
jgi:hypothetical protein